MPLQSSLTHKHTSNNLPFDSEKENRKVVQTKRQPQLQHPYSESEPHSHHQRTNTMAPMSEYTHNHSATANAPGPTYDYSSMFSGIMTKDGNNSLKNFDSCHHSCKEKFKRSFCKECGIFIPKSGTQVYREDSYKAKLTTHPDEVYRIMLQGEFRNREYLRDFPNLKYRKILVDLICGIASQEDLSAETVAIAVSYVDSVLTKLEIPKGKLQLFAICCLVAAAKFYEKDDKIPTFKRLYELCHGTYSIDLFKKTEMFIFDLLGWNLKTITPLQFAHFYLSKGCAFGVDHSVVREIDIKLLRYLRKYTDFFIDLSYQDYKLNTYPAHIVACAAVAGARKAVGLLPVWNSEMEELTEASWCEIEPCFNTLYKLFEQEYPQIALKTNYYAEKYSRKNEVQQLEAVYSNMTIESSFTGTPFKVMNKGKDFEKESSKKEQRPETGETLESMYQPKRVKLTPTWSAPMRVASVGAGTITTEGIRFMKKIQSESMNIESVCEELIRRESIGSNVKRNLVF